MNDLRFEHFFNEETLNIFTDASVDNERKLSAPGAVCVITRGRDTYILEEDFHERNILYNSTNNEGEITAVSLGVFYALKYSGSFKYINLFSDSNTCIQGLNDWIFNWINRKNENGRLIGTSGKEVANQDIFCDIINTIIDRKLGINFYHQKGHVKQNEKGHDICFNDFLKTNDINVNMDRDIIECISTYNDYVDKQTKILLKNFTNIYYNNDIINPIQYIVKYDRIDEYRDLIRRRKI